MATLLSSQTSDGVGSGASHTGPCTVFVSNDSVFDGAVASVEAYSADTSAKYVSIGIPGQLTAPGAINVNIQGAYYLRGRVSKAGSNTSINMDTTQ